MLFRSAEGDTVLGLASSGLHSNGFSLARAIIDRRGASLSDVFGDSTLGETLMAPTRIYVRSVLQLLKSVKVHGIAHITGGGLPGNIPRVVPDGLECHIHSDAWRYPDIFNWLQAEGRVEDSEMRRTFNCGIGLVLVVAKEDAAVARETLTKSGETVFDLGEIRRGPHGVVFE